MMAVATLAELVVLYGIIDAQHAIGDDLDFFRSVAQRWLDTGVYYTDHQLAGPYVVQTQVDNLYPPPALLLFVPFTFLPAILWWVIPVGLIGYAVWWTRPYVWAWPVLALTVLYPKTPAVLLYGNSDLWGVAFCAAGVRWGWPAALVAFKPSVGFLALPGILSRGWWIATAALVLVTLPLLSLWLDYPRVVLNSDSDVGRSLSDAPFFLLPFLAWFTSTRRADTSIRAWGLRLLTRRPA
jgi:hypothetical protein